MERNEVIMEDEITLREIIEILLNGKLLIAAITIAAIIISSLVSFAVLPETYQAKTTLLASPITLDKSSTDSIDNLTDNLNNYPDMTIDTYIHQITSPTVLKNTIQQLDLKDSSGNMMRAGALKDTISVTNIKNTNLLEISVSSQDPQKAAEIANALSQNFINFVTANNKKQSNQIAGLIEEQMTVQEQDLNEKSKELSDYLASSKSVDELQAEVTALTQQIVSYKTNLNNLDMQINADTQSLATLGGTDKVYEVVNPNDINVNVDLTNGASSYQVSLQDSSKVSSSLRAIDINTLQTRLAENIATKKASEDKLVELQKYLADTQTTLAKEQYKYNAINRELQLAEEAYNAYQERHKEAIMIAAADLGQTSIIVSSEANVPVNPVSPNKKLNIAIGGVLGLFVGAFVVFFMAYWKNSKVD